MGDQLGECLVLCHRLLHLSISFPTRVARGDEPLSGPRAGVESGQPKKFGAMFFKNCLPLLGGLDHFLGLVAFKARELYDRHNVVLPWLPKNYLMRLRAHAGALQRRLNTAAMPLPIEARNGRTAPPLGCKEKRHWPARRQTAGSASLMIRYRCRAGAPSSPSRTPAGNTPNYRRLSMPIITLITAHRKQTPHWQL